MTASAFSRYKYKIYAVILLVIIAVFVGLCTALYNESFTSFTPITVHASRSGLQMSTGNRVFVRGVDVGEVGDVKLAEDGQGADITVNLFSGMADKIPANSTVALDQLTAFGAKTVNLTPPAQSSPQTIQAGSTLQAGRVTVEANSLFSQLNRFLTAAQPAKVNSVLGGLSQTLDGRGEKIGQTVGTLSTYLGKINQDLPTLQTDFQKGSRVFDLYSDVTPDLGRILTNVTTTSQTLQDKQDQLHEALAQVKSLSGTGEDFFAENGDSIVHLAQTLLPTTRLLDKYSPEYTCFFKGLAESDRRLSQAWGNTTTGLHGLTTFVPGLSPYKYPDNLPVVGANNGPDCYGLPDLDGHKVPESLVKSIDKGFPPGKDPYQSTTQLGQPPVDAQIFGPIPKSGPSQAQSDSPQGTGGQSK